MIFISTSLSTNVEDKMSRTKRAEGLCGTARAPVYHKSNPKLRIASAPHGLWQVQRLVGEGGQRGEPKVKGKPWVSHDPWQEVYRPTTFAVAEAQMYGLQQAA
jgi:hypothetical protein